MYRFVPVLLFVTLAKPASAIDCGRAASGTEKAICANTEARAADQKLGEAYNQLRSLLPDDQRNDLRLSQIDWIKQRDARCPADSAIVPLTQCLIRESKERRQLFERMLPVGDQAGLFTPAFIFRPAARKTARLEIETIRLTGEGSAQANAAIDDLVRRANRDSQLNHDPDPGESYSVELDVSLSFASQRLRSVHVEYANYLGQAHPFHYSANIAVELPTGRELKFVDLMDDSRASELFQYCRVQVVKQKADGADIHGVDNPNDIDPKEVAEGTENFSRWQFKAADVEIDYGDYAFGGYGKCMCSCSIPYPVLRPWAKKDFPLPLQPAR